MTLVSIKWTRTHTHTHTPVTHINQKKKHSGLRAQLCVTEQLCPRAPPHKQTNKQTHTYRWNPPPAPPRCITLRFFRSSVLIKLAKQDGRCVRRTPFIAPVCLPDKSTTFPDGYCCTISGWGHIDESECGVGGVSGGGTELMK